MLALLDSAKYPGGHWKFSHYADQSVREREGRPSRGREPRAATELEDVCKRLGIRAEATEGSDAEPLSPDMNAWTVKLTHGKRSLTVPFFTGSGIEGEPTAADVLACIVRDAQSGAQSFGDFCSDLGYDADSMKANRRTWKACKAMAPRVRRLLGSDFDAIANAEH